MKIVWFNKNYQFDSSFFVCTNQLIPVGKNNRYGHSNKEALDNLANSKIYRTDED